jgi:hypothetical protein
MRLFGLTMVRDEADVIDAYVRHNLTVLDIIGRSFVPQQTQYVISGNHLVDDPARPKPPPQIATARYRLIKP